MWAYIAAAAIGLLLAYFLLRNKSTTTPDQTQQAAGTTGVSGSDAGAIADQITQGVVGALADVIDTIGNVSTTIPSVGTSTATSTSTASGALGFDGSPCSGDSPEARNASCGPGYFCHNRVCTWGPTSGGADARAQGVASLQSAIAQGGQARDAALSALAAHGMSDPAQDVAHR